MNTTTPKPLAQSREFLPLDLVGRLAVHVLWRRGIVRRWEDDELLSADDQVLLELELAGFFHGPRAAGPVPRCVASFRFEHLRGRAHDRRHRYGR